MKKLLPLIFLSTSILGLSGCGQTGPLYLPKEEKISSGSTIATSGSSIKNQPSRPAGAYNPTAAELTDGPGSGFNQNILDSNEAGGTPVL